MSVFKKKRIYHLTMIIMFSLLIIMSYIALFLSTNNGVELWNFLLITHNSAFATYHFIRLGDVNKCAKQLRDIAIEALTNKEEE